MLAIAFQQARITLPASTLAWWAMRLVWLAMAAGHLPALLGRMIDPGAWLAGLPLLLAEIYFVLKVLDVPWLRLPRTRKAWMAFVVIVVLLHAPVLASVVMHTDTLPWEVAVLPLLSLLVIACLAVPNRLSGSLVQAVRLHFRHRWRWLHSAWQVRLPASNCDLSLQRISAHGPPALVLA